MKCLAISSFFVNFSISPEVDKMKIAGDITANNTNIHAHDTAGDRIGVCGQFAHSLLRRSFQNTVFGSLTKVYTTTRAY